MAHSIGKTIAELRKVKGWTQVELAEKLQVSDKGRGGVLKGVENGN